MPAQQYEQANVVPSFVFRFFYNYFKQLLDGLADHLIKEKLLKSSVYKWTAILGLFSRHTKLGKTSVIVGIQHLGKAPNIGWAKGLHFILSWDDQVMTIA